ncbi:MAG: protein jag [Clostridia bacterium]|nr:protein jag [Clostridia bacterium]
MEYTEFTGKTVEDAVEKGLEQLGLTKETAEWEVIDEGKKGLFGRKARIKMAQKEVKEIAEKVWEDGATDGERAVAFLDGLFKMLNMSACSELISEKEKIVINVTAANSNAVIGKRGATLDALQTLAGAVANTGRDDYKRVVVDCENYREGREETLKKLAENLAQKAIRLGRKIKLEEMNPYERRIMHSALSSFEGVKTISEGKEPYRYVVIVPDNEEDPSAPAIPARGDRRDRDNRRGDRRDRGRGGRRDGVDRVSNHKRSGGRDRRESRGGSSSGGTTMKASFDFFGTFLGNSKDQ